MSTDLVLARDDLDGVRRRLGGCGVWLQSLGDLPAVAELEVVAEIESLGYGSLWIGNADAKDALAHAALLLAATERIVVATGIAGVYARDAHSMRAGSQALGEAYPGRFVLGLGVGHRPFVTARGHRYRKPIEKMRSYLAAMAEAPYGAPPPNPPVPVVIAALRDGMLTLAAEATTGAHPYFVPVAHAEVARRRLGADRLLVPELMAIVESDPGRARSVGCAAAAPYLGLPNYIASLRALGYSEEDLADGGSDRLIDEIFAWGSVEQIAARVEAHHAAGADHVVVQPLGAIEEQRAQLRALAPVLVKS